MGILRYQLFFAVWVFFVSIWWSLIQKNMNNLVILYAPIYVLIILGVYAIGFITIGLINFKDMPEAAKELEGEILEAKTELQKRGVFIQRD